MRSMLVLLLLVLIAGCDFHLLKDRQSEGRMDDPQRLTQLPPMFDDAELRDLGAQIQRVVRTEARRQSACTTIPIGAKPCGGPWGHIVYSASTTNEARLRSLVARFNERQAVLNERLGLYSDCSYVSAPRVALERGHCVAVSSR